MIDYYGTLKPHFTSRCNMKITISLIAATLIASSAFAQDVTVTGTGTLSATGVTAGSCGDTTHSCGLTIDAKGRISAQSNNSITGGTASPGGNPGDVQVNNAGALGGITLGSGQILVGQGGGALPDPQAITGGDCSMNSTGFMTCTQAFVGGQHLPFAPTATVDGTNASNITSGTLPDAQLSNIITAGGPLGSSTTVPQVTYDSHGRITAINSVGIALTSGTVTSVICPQEITITTTGTWSEAHPGYKTGPYWYRPIKMPITSTGSAVAANAIKCSYGAIPVEITLSNIGSWVTTAAATGHFEWALYSNANSRPNALIANSASISTAATGAASGSFALGTPQVGPGATSDVWWCFNSDNSTAVFRSLDSTRDGPSPSLIGSTNMANIITTSGWITGILCAGANCAGGSSTYGTWPSTLNGSTWSDIANNTIPTPAFQVSSVP